MTVAVGATKVRADPIPSGVTPIRAYSLCPDFACCSPRPRSRPRRASFDPQRLSHHVQTLGSDAFEGRAPATAGETKTVAYLADQFAKAGLQPGGDLKDGKRSWTQAVPLLRSEFAAAPQISIDIAGKPTPLTQGEQIAVRAPTNGDKAMAIDEAELVFVGYGVKAPERGWDDFKGQDARARSSSCWSTTPISKAAKAISAARR